jgi:hypothetical protein
MLKKKKTETEKPLPVKAVVGHVLIFDGHFITFKISIKLIDSSLSPGISKIILLFYKFGFFTPSLFTMLR